LVWLYRWIWSDLFESFLLTYLNTNTMTDGTRIYKSFNINNPSPSKGEAKNLSLEVSAFATTDDNGLVDSLDSFHFKIYSDGNLVGDIGEILNSISPILQESIIEDINWDDVYSEMDQPEYSPEMFI